MKHLGILIKQNNHLRAKNMFYLPWVRLYLHRCLRISQSVMVIELCVLSVERSHGTKKKPPKTKQSNKNLETPAKVFSVLGVDNHALMCLYSISFLFKANWNNKPYYKTSSHPLMWANSEGIN